MSKARIVLPIEGMSCASCAATVQAALGSAGGVAHATVNYATGKGAVDYDDAETNVTELIKTVRRGATTAARPAWRSPSTSWTTRRALRRPSRRFATCRA